MNRRGERGTRIGGARIEPFRRRGTGEDEFLALGQRSVEVGVVLIRPRGDQFMDPLLRYARQSLDRSVASGPPLVACSMSRFASSG